MLTLVLPVVNVIVFLISLQGNIFILGVNLLNWGKNKRLTLNNQLIFAIIAANLFHGILKCVRDCITIFKGDILFKTRLPQLMFTVLFITITSCILWFCTWLSVHLCLKIVMITNKFYIILQKKFLEMSPWVFLESILGSFLVSLLSVWNKRDEPLSNGNHNTSNYSITLAFPLNMKHLHHLHIYIMFYLAAFLLFFSSALAIIISLCGHMKRMKASAEGLRGHNMDALIRAAKTVTSLLVLNILYVLALNLGLFYRQNIIWRYLISALFSIFHILIAVVLIKGNKGLDTVLTVMLARCPCTRRFQSS